MEILKMGDGEIARILAADSDRNRWAGTKMPFNEEVRNLCNKEVGRCLNRVLKNPEYEKMKSTEREIGIVL